MKPIRLQIITVSTFNTSQAKAEFDLCCVVTYYMCRNDGRRYRSERCSIFQNIFQAE